MDEDLINRLDRLSIELHTRARELAHPGEEHDISLLMSSLAVTMEAVKSLGASINRLDGLAGLGGDGN